MKKLSLVLLFLLAGCCPKVPAFVPPPLHSPPALHSFQPMAHPTTLVPGFWMDRGDADDLGAFFGHIWNVKDKWK
mgnify:CR=1 FL=1